ncbi:MAG: ATP-binding protein [Planctomycetes bacterium]|nr:ATP-binding protein [Planctomycetota bacterium]
MDAGASEVRVELDTNAAGVLREIRINDNGTGIPYQSATAGFGTIGGSLKRAAPKSNMSRPIHGKEGKGRLRALSLGRKVTWKTVYAEGSTMHEYGLEIRRDAPTAIRLSDATPQKSTAKTGTTVIVTDPLPKADSLDAAGQSEEAFRAFALYIKLYGGVTLFWNDKPYDVNKLLVGEEKAELSSGAILRVLYWSEQVGVSHLHLCNEAGIALHEIPLGVDARDLNLTACVCSTKASEWKETGQLALSELDSGIALLISTARARLREVIAKKLEDQGEDLVQQWKSEGTYPFSEPEESDRGKDVERTTFNKIALKIAEHHQPLVSGPPESRKLTLSLVRQALESNPSSLMIVLDEVLKLPKEELEEFSRLLKRTKLSALISATRLVVDRLDTIQAFSHIVFDDEWKKKLLERTQLHRLLVHEAWVFGEEFSLLADDEDLEAALQAHLEFLGNDVVTGDVENASSIDDEQKIPDLLFGMRAKRSYDLFEHLVVELKRPKCLLTQKELSQIQDYAFRVASDSRFNTQKVKWRFVLLGTRLDGFVETMVKQTQFPAGCVFQNDRISIWVQTWSDLINEAKSRYEFFREKLAVKASTEAGMENFTNDYPHLMKDRGSSKKKDLAISALKRKRNRSPDAR